MTLWRYEPENGRPAGIRQSPTLETPGGGYTIEPGESFEVAEERPGPDGVLFLRLADGRGWLFDHNPQVCRMAVRVERGPEAGADAEVGVGPVAVPVAGVALKRARAQPLDVTAEEDGAEEIVGGLETLIGRYEHLGQYSVGQPVYEKVRADGTSACFLYYWNEPEEDRGWWFGDEIGGSMVYCYAKSPGFPPPVLGWHVPAEGDPPIECLRVRFANSLKAGPPRQPSKPPPNFQPRQQSKASTGVAAPTAAADDYIHVEFGPTARAQRLGVQLLDDAYPPTIQAIQPGTPAAARGLPVAGVIEVVNGRRLSESDGPEAREACMQALHQRPLTFDVRRPAPTWRPGLKGPRPPVMQPPPAAGGGLAAAVAPSAPAAALSSSSTSGAAGTLPEKAGTEAVVAMLAERLPTGELEVIQRLLLKVHGERQNKGNRTIWSALVHLASDAK